MQSQRCKRAFQAGIEVRRLAPWSPLPHRNIRSPSPGGSGPEGRNEGADGSDLDGVKAETAIQ